MYRAVLVVSLLVSTGLPLSCPMAQPLAGPASPRSVSECERYRGEYGTHLAQLRRNYNDCKQAHSAQPTSYWQPGWNSTIRSGPIVRVPSGCVAASDDLGSASEQFGPSLNQCLSKARDNALVRVGDLQNILVTGLKNRNSENAAEAAKTLANWCLEECKLPKAADGLKALFAAKGEADKIMMLPNLVMSGDVTSLVNLFSNTHIASSELAKHAALFTLEINQQYLRILENSLEAMSGTYAPPISQPDMVVKDYIVTVYSEMEQKASDIEVTWQNYQISVLNQTIESSLDQGGGVLAPGSSSTLRPGVGSRDAGCRGACKGPGCACR